jgi:alpha-glucosidase
MNEEFPVTVAVERNGRMEEVRVGSAVKSGDGFVVRFSEMRIHSGAGVEQSARRAAPVGAPSPHWDQPGVHEVYREWRALADSYDPPRVFVGEVWVHSSEALAQYLRPDELHTAFNFAHLQTPWWAAGLRTTIDESLAAAGRVGAPTTWVLENHDVWRAPTRYAPLAPDAVEPEPGATLHASAHAVVTADRDLVVGTARARAGMLVMLALPGSSYLYQGQELGLFEVLDIADEWRDDPVFHLTGGAALGRDGCRVPIPWSGEAPRISRYTSTAASRSPSASS